MLLSSTAVLVMRTLLLCLIHIKVSMNKKVHGRENDSVEVVPEVHKSDVAEREEAILSFWREHDIFNKSMERPAGDAPKGDYVFYDGPPFATGLPHYGHILASTIKDAVPRFWTMQGYRVRRKWGWDCHGLPLENLIEKKLGLATKRDIEEYGVKNFNEAAREAVLEYADDWKRIIPRMGRFVDMDNDYKTMDSSYTESVWWVFKSLHEKGLVYEGFKTMHLCPRCGTTLSNFEVNLGYKDIKDIAVTVKLPLLDEAGQVTDESLLVWTTTPWTLPGNVAAAINKDFTYVKVRLKEETGESVVILAKERLAQLSGIEYEELETLAGSELVSRSYQPPFPFMVAQLSDEQKQTAFKIWHADYVELGDEGTGAVHIAPAFGEDDMQLAKEHNIPIVHHVDESGRFKEWVEGFECQLVKPKDNDEAGILHLDADIEVVKALKERGVLVKKENITHSYPHCWRCDTPLLNYATTSWFVEVTKMRDKLVAENQQVAWVPEHVGTNRFGKWLEGARDWAVSRQRYWGAPLPIWKNPVTNEVKVFGSLEELQAYVPKSGNTYFTMRHGQSESNVAGIVSALKDNADGLTEEGTQQVAAAIKAMEVPDIIIHSGYQRTRETAELVAAAFPEAQVVEDERFGEVAIAAKFEGSTWAAYNEQFTDWSARYTTKLDEIENRRDVQVRVGQAMLDLETKYSGKKILIVSHSGTLFALESAAMGLTAEETEAHYERQGSYQNAEVREVSFVSFPHNDHFELDYHRPYIDDIKLVEDGVKLERVPDVFDCWFESGSMPYGQHHYPFECDPEAFAERFPANFISESIDQTRGWFYSMMVIGVGLFGKSPYQNVVTNGLVLAEDGKKMSKSLQNYPDPMELVSRQGADSMRFYLLSSPIIKGEDLNFSEKEVQELQRKNIGRLHNVLAMYKEYAEDGVESRSDSTHILDRWILVRLNELITETTTGFERYELDKATRPLIAFIDDLSVWYLRRSRDRLKGADVADKQTALATLRFVLETVAKVMAPAMPFYAEYLWQEIKTTTSAESVHLTAWPVAGEIDQELLAAMVQTREVVTAALEARVKAGIKVRQPIATVYGPALADELVVVVCEEVNAKAYEVAAAVALDTSLSPELLAEGAVRELMRAIQDARKKAGLQPKDRITLTIDTNDAGQAALAKHEEVLKDTVGAAEVVYQTLAGEVTKVTVGELAFAFVITS